MRRTALGLALLAATTVLAGATAASASASADAPADRDRPGHNGKSVGCRVDPPVAAGQTFWGTVHSGGRERSYLAEVPQDYAKGDADSLVLSFHGQGRDPEYQRELTRLAKPGRIAVYPQGEPGTEEGKTSWQGAPYSAEGVDDVRYTNDVLDDVQRKLCVDEDRVFAAGKSNGGGFTGLLACRLGDRIAAFASVSGAFYPQGGDCAPNAPVPVLEIHGDADNTIPYGGDEAKGLPAIPDWLGAWAQRNGCGVATASSPVDGVEQIDWQDCDDRGALRHYKVGGLAHDWPSTEPNPDSDQPSVIEGTELVHRFFDEHPRT